MNITLEVLHVPDCPNLAPMLDRLRTATDLPVTTREISTEADAATTGMNGSPTLLINGRDPFPNPNLQDCDCGVSCRIYRNEHGRAMPAPSVAQLRDAITAVTAADAPSAPSVAAGSANVSPGLPFAASKDESRCHPVRPGDLLSAWRAPALTLDPMQRAMHQAVLRAFAATGRPPARHELDAATVRTGCATADVLAALHELDAIRLGPDGGVAVAYPFSATPTRHLVQIGDRVEVYAMCAIDALGISAMLGEDTRIDSIDVTTGHPVTVTIAGGASRWDPAGAVVFIGADVAGGPSVDYCCDYLNFFTDTAAAQAWTAAHPQVPGQILNQAEAEALGARLFGHLLAPG